MQPKERRQHLVERVLADGEIDFVTLAVDFRVSEMTIRRDVDELESRGIVRRVLGGAIAIAGKASEPSFATRVAEASVEKAHIAEAIVNLLAPQETVILDGGSSALAVARAIKGRGRRLTVVTASLLVALELHDEPDTTVLIVGGLVRPGELSIVGTEAENAFERYNCDVFVMGVAGVHATRGLSDYHREEAQVKHAAMLCADRTIVAATSNKLGRTQLMTVGPLNMITTLVTDCDTDDPTAEAASRAGVDVVRVERTGTAPDVQAADAS